MENGLVSLGDLGFKVEAKTERMVLLKNEQVAFWRARSSVVSDAELRVGAIDAPDVICERLAKMINESWVSVNVMEETPNGGARVSFQARRKFGCDQEAERASSEGVALTKRGQVWVPAAAIVEFGGGEVKAVSPSFINKKLGEGRSKCRSNRGRDVEWRAVPGGVATAERVLKWMGSTLEVLRTKHDEEMRVKRDARLREKMAKDNASIYREFDRQLLGEYGEAASKFSKLVAGRRAGLSDLTGIALVKAALVTDGFREYLKRWQEKMRARATQPTRVPKERLALETVKNCTVKWVCWTTVRGSLKRTDCESSGCTAQRFSSRKWTITMMNMSPLPTVGS